MKIIKIVLLIILAVVLIIVLVTGGRIITNGFGIVLSQTQEHRVTVDAEYDCEDFDSIVISLISEDISFSSVAGDRLTVHHYTANNTDAVNISLEERVLYITEPESSFTLFSQSGTLSLGIPESYDGYVTAETASGNVSAAEITAGDLSVMTVSGNVEVFDSYADTMLVSTSSGNVNFINFSGRYFEAGSASGNVHARFADIDDTVIHTVSGDVALSFETMPSIIEADTVSGNAEVYVPVGEAVYAEFDSVSGNMENYGVILSKEADTEIKVNTASGNFTLLGIDENELEP